MADKKISALTSASTPLAGTEVLPIVQSGATVKVAISDVTAGRAVSALSFTAPTIGAGASSALTIQSNATTGATMDTSQNIGFGTTTINGYYGSTSVTTRGVFSYSSASTNCDTAPKGLVVRNDDTTTSNLSMLAFGTLNTNNTPIATAAVWSVNDARTSGFSTGSLRFGTNGGSGVISDRANISSSGDFTLAVGNFIQGTAAKGVNFTANTPAAGMTSQLLNWYEEGDWTPTDASGAGLTLTVTYAKYVRVGKQVTVNAFFSYPSTASGANAVVGGLPFTVEANNYLPGLLITNSTVTAGALFNAVATTFGIVDPTSYGTARTNTQMSTVNILLSATYFV